MAAKKTTTKPVNPVPRGFRTVTAVMNVSDASAQIAFCKKAFGAKVVEKMAAPGGKVMHATLAIGNSVIMLADAVRDPVRFGTMCLYLESVDKTLAKAVKAGATVVMPARDMFWGDRFAVVIDPQGNQWSLATHIENVKPDEMKKRAKEFAKQMAKR